MSQVRAKTKVRHEDGLNVQYAHLYQIGNALLYPFQYVLNERAD